MAINAKADLAKNQASYNSVKASCDGKKQARVQAQSLLDAAESAWRTRWAAGLLACRSISTICVYFITSSDSGFLVVAPMRCKLAIVVRFEWRPFTITKIVQVGRLLWWLHPNGKTQVTLSCGHAGKTGVLEHALASSVACENGDTAVRYM